MIVLFHLFFIDLLYTQESNIEDSICGLKGEGKDTDYFSHNSDCYKFFSQETRKCKKNHNYAYDVNHCLLTAFLGKVKDGLVLSLSLSEDIAKHDYIIKSYEECKKRYSWNFYFFKKLRKEKVFECFIEKYQYKNRIHENEDFLSENSENSCRESDISSELGSEFGSELSLIDLFNFYSTTETIDTFGELLEDLKDKYPLRCLDRVGLENSQKSSIKILLRSIKSYDPKLIKDESSYSFDNDDDFKVKMKDLWLELMGQVKNWDEKNGANSTLKKSKSQLGNYITQILDSGAIPIPTDLNEFKFSSLQDYYHLGIFPIAIARNTKEEVYLRDEHPLNRIFISNIYNIADHDIQHTLGMIDSKEDFFGKLDRDKCEKFYQCFKKVVDKSPQKKLTLFYLLHEDLSLISTGLEQFNSADFLEFNLERIMKNEFDISKIIDINTENDLCPEIHLGYKRMLVLKKEETVDVLEELSKLFNHTEIAKVIRRFHSSYNAEIIPDEIKYFLSSKLLETLHIKCLQKKELTSEKYFSRIPEVGGQKLRDNINRFKSEKFEDLYTRQLDISMKSLLSVKKDFLELCPEIFPHFHH